MGRVTLQTIADHVGVSRMTVSNAFSRPDQLPAGLRDRILAITEQLAMGFNAAIADEPAPTGLALRLVSAPREGIIPSIRCASP